MSTVSAHPVRLLAFAAANRQRSLALRPAAADLEDHLRRLSARCPGVAAPNLADDVRATGQDLDGLADLVEEVAQALLEADESFFSRYGGLLTNLRGLGLIWRAVDGSGPAAGRFGMVVFIGRTITDARGVIDQGNPLQAFQRRGTDYLADVEQVRLDALLVVLGVRPSPETAVAAAISFRMWAELATWDERRHLALAGLRGLDRVQDGARNAAVSGLHRATSWLRSQLDATFGDGDPGPVVIPPPLPLPRPVRALASDVLDRVDDAADRVDAVVDAVADRLPWPR